METTLRQVLEALIFASPKPLGTAELVAAVRAAGESSELDAAQALAQSDEAAILEGLKELETHLEQTGSAFRLFEQANGWGFVTRPEFAPWVRQLYPEAKPARLSGPALETLAIIAYRQPVTRADIEAVRGVAVDGVMQVLLDRSLVRIAGRADMPGRPLLYSTTDYFLEHFGLKTTHELPNASELSRMPLPTAPPPEEKPAGRRKGKAGEAPAPETAELPLESSVATVAEPTPEPPFGEARSEAVSPAESEPVSTSDTPEQPSMESASTDFGDDPDSATAAPQADSEPDDTESSSTDFPSHS